MENNENIEQATEVMENLNKPTAGTYRNMTPSGERKPKVEFIFNRPVEVYFSKDYEEPTEFPSTQDKGAVYYLYNCVQNGEERIFMTSAWSLLQGLKNLEPLAGKNILITKDMKDGKQHYSVVEVENTDDDIPVVRPGESPDVPK